jgi:hypothetical protein
MSALNRNAVAGLEKEKPVYPIPGDRLQSNALIWLASIKLRVA